MPLSTSVYGFIGALSLVLYIGTLWCGFVWDDRAAIVSNVDVRATLLHSGFLIHDFWGQNISQPDSHKSYRPITTLSYKLDHTLYGLSATGFHLSNAFIYAATCIGFLWLASLWLTPEGYSHTSYAQYTFTMFLV